MSEQSRHGARRGKAGGSHKGERLMGTDTANEPATFAPSSSQPCVKKFLTKGPVNLGPGFVDVGL